MKFLRLLCFGLLFTPQLIWAHDLILRNKIAQMLMIGFDGKSLKQSPFIQKAIREDHIGGVILFDYHYQKKTFDKNIETPAQVQKLNADLQHWNQISNLEQHLPDLPLLIAVDYEGGRVNRLKETYGFPATKPAAEMGQMDFIEADHYANTMATTLKKAGFNVNLAPVLDLNLNIKNPIIGMMERSFSEDPASVATFANLFSHHFLTKGIQCAYKHFPGHGSAYADSHLGFVDSTDVWQSSELEPYQEIFASGDSCGMVMTAHIINRQLDASGLPATLSYQILNGILRERLHFSGVIITDDMQMKAITDNYGIKQALILAINAGADMFIFGNQLSSEQDPKALVDIIESEVQLGHITSARIDEAYQRILHMKQMM